MGIVLLWTQSWFAICSLTMYLVNQFQYLKVTRQNNIRLSENVTPSIWVNYNNSQTWIKAIWGWFPLLTMIIVRSQWGRYNLPRSIPRRVQPCATHVPSTQTSGDGHRRVVVHVRLDAALLVFAGGCETVCMFLRFLGLGWGMWWGEVGQWRSLVSAHALDVTLDALLLHLQLVFHATLHVFLLHLQLLLDAKL